MEAENDPIAEVNKRIQELQEGTLELTKGAFEGISLPLEFDKTLRDLEAFPEDEDDTLEEGLTGEASGEAEETPQVTLKTLKDIMQETEAAKVSSPSHMQSSRADDKFPPMTADVWGQIADDELKEGEEDAGTREVEEKEEETPREEEYRTKTAHLRGWEDQVVEPLDLPELIDRVSQLGVSLDKKELLVLQRKHSVMGGLSVRDSMMFVEGLRTANTIAEAQITESLKGFSRALEQQKAHVRNLEKSVSEIKMAEKNYLELLEKLSSEKASVQEKVDRQVRQMLEIEKRKLVAYKEAKERELVDELRAKKEKVLSAFKERASGSGRSSPRIPPKKEPSVKAGSVEGIQKREKISYHPGSFELTHSEMEAGAELTSLSEYTGKGAGELAEHYELTVEQMNDELSGFPKSVSGWVSKFKNPMGAADAVHRHLMGRESRTG